MTLPPPPSSRTFLLLLNTLTQSYRQRFFQTSPSLMSPPPCLLVFHYINPPCSYPVLFVSSSFQFPSHNFLLPAVSFLIAPSLLYFPVSFLFALPLHHSRSPLSFTYSSSPLPSQPILSSSSALPLQNFLAFLSHLSFSSLPPHSFLLTPCSLFFLSPLFLSFPPVPFSKTSTLITVALGLHLHNIPQIYVKRRTFVKQKSHTRLTYCSWLVASN